MTETTSLKLSIVSIQQTIRAAQEEAERDDADAALARLAQLRVEFPDIPAGYSLAATLLIKLNRYDEAETILSIGKVRLPDIGALWVEHARCAHNRGDFAEATRRWSEVRSRFPDEFLGYTAGAKSLESAGDLNGANQLLTEALAIFPDKPAVVLEYAWSVHKLGKWSEAISCWEQIRKKFPKLREGYFAGATAHRQLSQFEAADALLEIAVAEFPTEPRPLIERAWLAAVQRAWQDAAARWQRVRELFPDVVDGYLRGASALSEMSSHSEAEAVLAEGLRRFPEHRELLSDYARSAEHAGNHAEAESRYRRLRELFPNLAAGYIGGGRALCNLLRPGDAEELVREGLDRLPDDPQLSLEYARAPLFPSRRPEKNYDEALRRLCHVRDRFPKFEHSYVVSIRTMREANRLDEAERLGESATRLFPASGMLALEHAHSARVRADWLEAKQRYTVVRERFPHEAMSVVGLARVLSAIGEHQKTEEMLRDALSVFPDNLAIVSEYASISERKGDWEQSLARWQDVQKRFPHAKGVTQRVFEAQLRLAESGNAPVATGTEETRSSLPGSMPELLLHFESLGGTMLGCEFGLLQREWGVEPLGLLRWTDIAPAALSALLADRLEGVGEEANTRLIVRPVEQTPEYATADSRYGMVMHTFVNQSEVPPERMFAQSCRRLRFLRQKLVDDLETARKIFVYKITNRSLTDDEISSIYSALRKYGDATLLCVRYEDAEHPNGTVEISEPGLLVGYIDQFGISKDGDRLPLPVNSWSNLCKRAYELWTRAEPDCVDDEGKNNTSTGATAESGSSLVLNFESLGGTGHGCEFGIFQRSQGAEPLGLLRWADLPNDALVKALECRFGGVGKPEHTEIFVPEGSLEYWTRDKRFHMAMRSFIRTSEVSLEKVTRQMHRRLQFLCTKLIEDLEQGGKIFVYKNMFRNLGEEEIAHLHAAVRSYGKNTLLYVRRETPGYRSGRVERAAPGLLIGTIDHFAFSPNNEALGHNTDGWLALCRIAYRLWREDCPIAC